MSLPHAVIIAGGKGERLGGVRKADLRIGGRRLLDRVIESLGAVAAPLMLSTGPTLSISSDCVSVADLNADVGGPLAGLAAAVAHLDREGVSKGLLVSVAVDTPFLPRDFVAQMKDRLGDSAAAFAAWEDDFYPPNAIWRIEALTDLPERVRRGKAPNSLKALQVGLFARRIDWTEAGGENPFRNINTIADLLSLGKTLRG
ncbi:molybdenum cofactor guanylyltransferase [Devosia sp. 2618]|uniref:molybdenum cofactor guanylyltransferase n=1 Tax=Devosia sp. 2618 TaxID=3156454 RepID=UPI003394CDB4